MPLPNIDEITEADLQNLVNNAVLELKTLDYKRILPGNSDGEKKEFLADIVSFANSMGGDIIYGISENSNHVPTSLDGIEAMDEDGLKLRLDSIIRDGIQPRIPNIQIRTIPLHTGRIAVIIRIPKSWLNPHMVSFQHSSRFYSRASNGKYQMDIGEIRSAFSLSESRIQRIKEFVQSRISDIYSDNAQIQLTNFPKMSIHIIPFSSMDTQIVENFDRLDKILIFPMFTGNINRTFNTDGYLSYSPESDGVSKGYVQIYRNGVIEAVSSIFYEGCIQTSLPIYLIENGIITALKNYSILLKVLSVNPPAFVFITLMKVQGLGCPDLEGHFRSEGIPIQKDIIFLPNFELTIFGSMEEAADFEQFTITLKPTFDALFNSVGLPRSQSYNGQGKWDRPI